MHFIFELLQNAEDALRRRPVAWRGRRTVSFELSEQQLRVSHSGEAFNAADVQAVCSVGETTKELTDIGRFGIGFKSVYAFTDRPEIHSGAEDFAIEGFVRPVAVAPTERSPDETVILISLKVDDESGRDEIAAGLRRLGTSALLFLRQIEEIEWRVHRGHSGLYLRSQPDDLGDGVRRVTVIGQEESKPDIEEIWLVFSRPVYNTGVSAGHVELAFSIVKREKLNRENIRAVSSSPLVVFFPTAVDTHLGFLVQGPYRTTPSRDNVPRKDPWNQYLVQETSMLLVKALRWLRDHDLLDIGALRCLPLVHEQFRDGSMFGPLFDATKGALATEALLPREGGGHAASARVRLASTHDLRELFNASQLAALLGVEGEVAWLSGEISQERAPELRQYLMRELNIVEITPATMLSKLNVQFLEAQSDTWVLRLYEFLNGQTSLRQKAVALPLIRLANGKHVMAFKNCQPQAFLPGSIETGFPTVRSAVCSTTSAIAFLRALGVTEPDLVDDVVVNVLRKYDAKEICVSDSEYATDIGRILNAFVIDSKVQREKLLAALRQTPFVMTVNTEGTNIIFSKPGKVYLATDRLKELFAGVPDVLQVDDRLPCLRGEDVRELLEACGAVRYLRPIENTSLSIKERQKLRAQAGHASTSGYNDQISDWSLLGLNELLCTLPKLAAEERRTKSILLWEELAHLEERRGKGVFTGEYSWTHYGNYSQQYPAAFVRLLNSTEWIPDPSGNLQRPDLILFDSLGWKENPFLLSKIPFKPPIIEQLAKEIGIEPGVLGLLKKHGVSEAKLRELLGLRAESAPVNRPVPPVSDDVDGKDKTKRADIKCVNPPPGSTDRRSFISYVAVSPDDGEPDPDGLDQPARMALEEKGIQLILASESKLQRTPSGNPGYDLVELGDDDNQIRWVEVKAMSGGLSDRPVGLSRCQFDFAREHKDAYWLYVVEHAADEGKARIVRIQNPAGKARTFTFDHGWMGIAIIDGAANSTVD